MNKTTCLIKSLRPVLLLLALCAALAVCGGRAAEEQGLNLAPAKPCRVFSSHEADGWSVTKLTDEQTGELGWSSKAFTAYPDHTLYPEFVVVDLGTNSTLERMLAYPRGDGTNAGRGFPKDFSIQVCREGEPWRVVLEKHNFPSPANGEPLSFLLGGAEGRYLKMEATRLQEVVPGRHHFQLAEVSVFGQPIGSPPLVQKKDRRSAPTTLGRLRCENRDNPVGIDVEQPRFSWWLESTLRDERQTAYRVLVASSSQGLAKGKGDMWDSGKVKSDRSMAVTYGGKPLRSGQAHYWKIQAWDRNVKPTAWSQPASFVIGKLHPGDWASQWIGADQDLEPISGVGKPQATSIHLTANAGHRPVYLRKEVEVIKSVRRAMVFFSGLGFSELYIEGQKVGDYVVGPGFTTYNKRVPYLAYDVTDRFLKAGRKALGIILVDGWYGNGLGHNFEKNPYVDKPKLRLDLVLEHSDGTETVVTSDPSWRWSDGEITCSGIVQEDIDRRRARHGWSLAGYDDREWRPVVVVKAPEGKLVHRREEPTRIVDEIQPVSLHYDAQSKTATFDFGQEFCGWVRFRTAGPAATSIFITTIPTANLPRTSRFILAGTGKDEVYEPRFFYAGMRRVVVKGMVSKPKLEDLTGCLVSMSWKPSGSFRCSDDVANWLYETTRRTVVAYTTWLPNDPSREWKAWMQDPQSMFWSTAYLFDAQTMYERWQWDIIDGQRPDGSSPNIAPGSYFDGYNSPWWGGCLVWLPWHWYQYYGDLSLLRDSYPAMKRYMAFLASIESDGLQDWGLADWLPVEETPRPIINTAGHYLFATIVQRTAELLGEEEDTRRFAQEAKRICDSFNRRYLDTETGIYGQAITNTQPATPARPAVGQVPHEIWWTGNRACTQAGQVLPLALGMVPAEYRALAKRALLKEIAAHRNRVSTGFVSTPYLLALLADQAPELGHLMTSAQDYPSWWGMTAGSDHDLMKETWAGGEALMPSLGGNIVAWYEQALAGIRPDPTGPGFKKIIIKPYVPRDMHWAQGHYDSVHGRIASRWRKRDNELVMEVTIPANATATIFVPANDASNVTESGKPAAKSPGVRLRGHKDGTAVYNIISGTYIFHSLLPESAGGKSN